MAIRSATLILILLLSGSGCARMVVKKDPPLSDKGIRYYRPKPYLFIGPAAPPASSKPANQSPADGREHTETGADGAITYQPVLMKIEYLPDYSEEYSIRMTPGLGTTQLSVNLDNGWNLTSVNAQSDQKYAEIIGSLASLTSAVGGLRGTPTHSAAASATYAGADCDVPLGYYEAVLAVNECGRKELMGWRYVGFFAPGLVACPVKAAVQRNEIMCDPTLLYAVVFDGTMLRMKRLDSLCQNPTQFEYRDEQVPTPNAPELKESRRPTAKR